MIKKLYVEQKFRTLMLTLALSFGGGSALAITQDASGVYQIGTADDLYDFAQIVSGTHATIEQNKAASAILTDDIVVNENVLENIADSANFRKWTPIGNSSSKYEGTFNGKGHTISGLYFNNSSMDQVGLFGIVCYAQSKIDSVGVIDSYIKGNDYVGGLCGDNVQGNISNCYFSGSVSGNDYVGGVCGDNNSTISNCYNTGSVSAIGSVGGVCGSNTGTVSNCYYLASESNGSDAKTAAQFASGEVAYLLSHGDNDGSVWGQKIGTDTIPVFSSDAVYSYINCQEIAIYTNDETLDGLESIHIYKNGICENEKADGTVCDYYQPATYNDAKFEIANVGELYWFANWVNSGTTNANAILIDDIVVNDTANWKSWNENTTGLRSWTPIGNDSKQYTGTFNGNGHTISGLYFSNSETGFVGLFGYISNGEIESVGVLASYINGNYSVGGICGKIENGTISNSYNTGSVIGSGDNVGGVCGYNQEGTISNCYNTVNVIGSGENVGDVCGYNASGTISNCYCTSETIVGTNEDGTITSCDTKTAAQFASGEVTILLQKYVDESDDATLVNWTQRIGDANPLFENVNAIGGTGIQYMREKKSNNWGTLCMPYAIRESNATFYTIDKKVDDVLMLNAFESEEGEVHVDAGVPVIYYCAEDTLMVLVQDFGNDKLAFSKNDGLLKGVYEQTTVYGVNTYYLKDDKFYPGNDNFVVGAFKAYIYLSEVNPAPRPLSLMLSNGNTTGIENIEDNGAADKREVEAVYNTKGQRVSNMQKGVIYLMKMSDGSTMKVKINK